jgi:hypothetical protein
MSGRRSPSSTRYGRTCSPAEQARIVQLLVERVDVRMRGVEVRLRPNGLAGLVREVAGSRRAAA